MPKQYDATLKSLVERYPFDWLRLLGVEPAGPVELIDTDLSTITALPDKVVKVSEAEPWLLNVELQASYDPSLPERMAVYSLLLSWRHGLPVRSVVFLLRREADGPAMSGVWQRQHPRTGSYFEFHYDVVRVWREPSARLLAAGPGVIPLAVVTDDAQPRLDDIIRLANATDAVQHLSTHEQAALLSAEYILLGLRKSPEFVSHLIREVTRMKESSTYQAILEEGRAEGRLEGRREERLKSVRTLRENVLRVGTRFCGEPSPDLRERILALSNSDTLDEILKRLVDVDDWDAIAPLIESGG